MMEDSGGTLRDKALVGRLIEELEAGRPFALASVLATRGSMPRAAGARMALLADGTWLGTIGGGRVEQMAQDRCRAILAGTEEPSLEWLTHAKTGMACGGDALVGVRLSLGADLEAPLLRDLLNRMDQGQFCTLDEVWDDPARVRLSLTPVDQMEPGDPRATTELPLWDEETRHYAEPVGPQPIAFVFGAGHVGQALCPVLAHIGFRVVVFDDREGLCTEDRFPQAERVVCGDFQHIYDKVSVTRRDYAVVTTHGHAADIDVLEQLGRRLPAYVGCIGSRTKAAFAREELVRRGIDAQWAQGLHLPIGEDILAVTPAEIAVSIAAQMIRCRAELRPQASQPHAQYKK